MKDTRINIVKGIIRLVFHITNVVLHKVIERKQQKEEGKEIPQPEEERSNRVEDEDFYHPNHRSHEKDV